MKRKFKTVNLMPRVYTRLAIIKAKKPMSDLTMSSIIENMMDQNAKYKRILKEKDDTGDNLENKD